MPDEEEMKRGTALAIQGPQPDPDALYAELEDKVKKAIPDADLARLRSAYEFARLKHGGQLRLDGSEFVTHPIAVAVITADMGMDLDCVIAALLHDTVEDTDATHEEISKKFSEGVAELVEGVTKLTRVKYDSREEEQMENLRKMLMAMAKDIRVILIKLSDRLHNMRTLGYRSPDKQRQVALETMEVYAPIAHRLGMQKVKWELEDTSLFYLDPIGYNDIARSIERISHENEGFIDRITSEISDRMKSAGIEATVYGRVKHIYSLYRKMYSRNMQLGEVYDYFAFRVVVDTIPECYNVLGHIHDQFKPVPGRFKDYIGTPKPNLYQSLHTVVIGSDGIPFEVQIRTWEMHNIAEYGIAAHWKYKRGMGARDMGEGKFEWIRRLLESQEEMDAEEFVSNLKTDMFADEVFVFTPRGDLINLPAGATPIDFAYAIHSAVGNRMVGAKVNSRMVPYDYVLQNGDIAEVITSNSGHGPSRDWINIAKSNEARTKIRQWFKKERRDENIARGKSSFDSELKRAGLTMDDLNEGDVMSAALKKMTYASFEDMLASIGYGGLTSQRAVNRFKEECQRLARASEAREQTIRIPTEARRRVTESGVEVQGLDNCLTKFSRCCLPVPGDRIIGFITRGFGVSVHREDCPNVREARGREEDRGRWVAVNWANAEGQLFETRLIVYSKDKDGLVLDVATALNALKVRITSLHARSLGDGGAEVSIFLTVTGLEQLNQVMSRLYRFSGIKEVKRG